MKLRIIAAVIFLPVLYVLAMLVPPVVTVVFIGLFSAIGTFELLHNTHLVTNIRLIVYSMIASCLMAYWGYFDCPYPVALCGVLVLYVLIFAELMISGTKIPFSTGAVCMVGAVVVPFLFTSLARILSMDVNRSFILLPFVIAFMSDAGAYFVGVTMGKHKLAPLISPKKTVEGLFGGLVTGILGTIIYGLVLEFACDLQINYFYAAIYGVLGALAGVFGDLSFSVVKRQTGIKDYGNLIPGHGGVLDRFDSVICVSPLVELLMLVIPMAS